MALGHFLNELIESGNVSVAELDVAEDEDRAELRRLDGLARRELAGEAPPLEEDAAVWALEIFHAACVFLVDREVEAESVRARLAEVCPGDPGASRSYSADLVMRYLPDLVRLSRERDRTDVLGDALVTLGRDWPLSSVGMDLGATSVDPGDFIDDLSCRMLYLDRIIATGDRTRLDDEGVRAALGTIRGGRDDIARDLVMVSEEGGRE